MHSETSNDQSLLNPFYHYIKIKMKAYMMVGGGGGVDTLPWGRLSPPPQQANIDYVHRDEIGENVSSKYPLEGLSETSNN